MYVTTVVRNSSMSHKILGAAKYIMAYLPSLVFKVIHVFHFSIGIFPLKGEVSDFSIWGFKLVFWTVHLSLFRLAEGCASNSNH